MQADRRLLFDRFSLDPGSEQLCSGGDVVALTPKAFAVLSRLVEDGGKLVSKADLMRAGWARTHVGEGVLKVVILEIRRALGDDAAAPRFIETVPRRGYRFIAERRRPAAVAPAEDGHGALVGRDGVLAQLEDRLARSLAGQRQIVFLSGEAGIGKTALLDAFRARAAADPDLLVAHGACLEHYGAAEAYLPVLDALSRLLRELRTDAVIRVLESHAPSWLVQLPWLERRGDREALRRQSHEVTKERMLREMAEAIESLTATTPLILVLEDLHWSDCSTLDLLGMLARRQGPARLLVVGTYRPVDAIVAGHPLRAVIRELQVRRECEDVPLAFLGEADVGAYLARRFGAHRFPDALARAVCERTEGNPLFVVRLADELVTLGVVAEQKGQWRLVKPLAEIDRAMPESLRALVEQQIDRLEPEARRLVEAASVLGNEFTIGSLAAALDADPLAVEDRCNELARQGQVLSSSALWARPDGTQVARYHFIHSLYPHAIAERVSPGLRLRLHQRVGEWLEQTYGAGSAAIASPLAWHFEEAGDHDRAIRYLIQTSENAAARCAFADAIRVLEHARSLVHHLSAKQSEIEIELLRRIGDAHFWRGTMKECTEAHLAAAARAADAGLVAARVQALSELVVPFGLIDPDRGIAAVEEAALLSAGLDDPLLRARTTLLAAGTRLMFDTWRTKDWELCESARDTIRRISGGELPVYHRVVFAHVQMARGDYAEALADIEAGIPQGNGSASTMVHFVALSGKALALLAVGRLGELARLLRTGRETAEENGNDPWFFVFREAWLATAILDFARARELCEGMSTRAAAANWRGQSETMGGIAAGYASLEQGDYAAASRSFTRVLDPEKTPRCFLHWYWRMNAQLGLGNVWLTAGDLGRAGREADGYLRSALSTDEPNLQALAWELGARVSMAEKDWKGAQTKIEKALAVLQGFEIPTTAWRIHATRSELSRLVKDEVAAEAERARAESIIVALADSFAPDDPLRQAFLDAEPVRRIRRAKSDRKRPGAPGAKRKRP